MPGGSHILAFCLAATGQGRGVRKGAEFVGQGHRGKGKYKGDAHGMNNNGVVYRTVNYYVPVI